MANDLLSLQQGQRLYSLPEIVTILARAMNMGLPLEAGSWVEELTIAQIERLVNGQFDA